MGPSIHQEIYGDLKWDNPARLAYTRKAFGLLPRLNRPRILDVGCGRGDPTLELARLSGGDVTGLDSDRKAVAELTRRAAENGLGHRCRAVCGSLDAMDFPDGSFDLIWAEASIHVIGFEVGLHDWRRFLKRGGFLVVHDMAWLRPDPPAQLRDYWQDRMRGIRTVREYVVAIPRYGYDEIGHFALPQGFWWEAYYRPLEARIGELRAKYKNDREKLRILRQQQEEVDLYKAHERWFGSAYLLMRKRDE